ncbi:hypothetical protein [Azospirillum sp. Sh1]|uniref:hypothetical protein n=1 Tax=Azospirillum sp. Sh1 TaxID=2607285 RepID=UPI0011EC9827|nr:hypothetical protein [Azospirillum sp. Sh1]KAA0570129.1 hypothetical protein FZ029_31560 [Azospirillum sp. Sh1]
MQAHPDTIHFDDKPWGVRGYVYENSSRYTFTVPEDIIFAKTGKSVLTPSEMVEFVKSNISVIEEYCNKYAKKRAGGSHPMLNGDEIIITQL